MRDLTYESITRRLMLATLTHIAAPGAALPTYAQTSSAHSRALPFGLVPAPVLLIESLLQAPPASPPTSFQATPPRASTLPASQLELPRLVDLAAERLRLAIDYDAATLKGSVALRISDALSDRELWDLTNRTLASRGFTTVRAPGSNGLSVVKLSEAKALAAVIDESGTLDHHAAEARTPDAIPSVTPTFEPGFTSIMIRVEHRAAKDVIEPVKLLLSKEGGSITALGDTGLVVVSDLSTRVSHAKELLAALDAPGSASVEEIEVKFLTSAQLAPLAMQVAARRANAGGEPLKGEVIPSPNANSILIVAPPNRVSAWRELVARLDRREPVETVTYMPRFFGIRDVSKLIEDAVKDGPAGLSGDDRFRIIPDELTGSLIITSTPGQHTRIKELIERLDAVSGGAPRPVKTFLIRNRPVTEVLSVVQQLVDAGALDSDPADTGLASTLPREPTSAAGSLQSSPGAGAQGQPGPGAVSTSPPSGNSRDDRSAARSTTAGADVGSRASRRAAQFPLGSEGSSARTSAEFSPDRSLNLTADPGTNTIIAVGEPRALALLDSLLKTIDVRQPQVMMEVMLVSLTEAQGIQLGVEIEKLTNIANTQIRLASLFGLSAGGAAGRAVGDAAGFTGTALNPGEFSLVVRALQSMNNGRSLSAPQVLVNNNQQAVLSSVLQQPFASTNASSTVATTSFGGTQDAGTTLTIRPQIAEGDHLVLQYSVALSSFVGSSGSATLPPPRQQNTVQSTVTIPDGYTVVVGGLELETESKSVTQVPLLGDVPVVGELFKSRDTSRSKSRFFVFIRAGVLRSTSFEDLKYVSDAAAARMGMEDGFPEVEPRVMR